MNSIKKMNSIQGCNLAAIYLKITIGNNYPKYK